MRARHVVLAPERVLTPDAISIAILLRCGGEASVAEIARELGALFDGEPARILDDVIEHLQDLSDRGIIRL